MNITITYVGERQFLCLGTYASIPVDRINSVDFDKGRNRIEIFVDNPREEDKYAFSEEENVDALKTYFQLR